MDEATEWRDKYDKNAKRLNKADVELTELRRVSEVLKQKGAEDAADGDACTSERTRLESEVRAHLINEAAEKKAREDSSRKVKELEEDLTSARIQRDREKREEEALRADLAQAQEDVSLLEEELARHKRWKQQVGAVHAESSVTHSLKPPASNP
jgi:chromosome segregation ATPase